MLLVWGGREIALSFMNCGGGRRDRKLPAELQGRAIANLSDPVYQGFRPRAAEYLKQKHQITVGKEALRGWMAKAGLHKAGRRRMEAVHEWRQGAAAAGSWCSGHQRS